MSSDDELLALRAAVTIARSEQVHSLAALKSRLLGMGFSDAEITTAVRTWGRLLRSAELSALTPSTRHQS